jgi:hypothetical protein
MRGAHALGVLLALAISCAPDAPAAEEASRGAAPLRIREVHVPYEELLRRSQADPQGVVLELEEYRALVLAGLAEGSKEPPLPPVAAAVVSAEHRGVLDGHTARFDSTLEVRVSSDGWVLCELGPVLPALGRIAVEGRPGWTIIGPAVEPRAEKAAASRSYLLLRGKGVHRVELSFSLAALETEERWTVSGPLPRALAARLLLDVPGRAEAQAPGGLLAAVHDAQAGRTRLELALGSAESCALEWRSRLAVDAGEPLLAAGHRLTFLGRPGSSSFVWEVEVTIARRKADRLELTEPAGAGVVSASGAELHSWERDGGKLRVLLNEPVLGRVKLRFQGFLAAEEAGPGLRRFTAAAPALAGAVSNSGYLGICDLRPERLQVERVEGALEVALGEGSTPPLGPVPLGRLFSFSGASAAVTLLVGERRPELELRAACRARILEETLTLEGAYQVRILDGRAYRLGLELPPPWKLKSLAAGGRSGPGLRFDVAGAPGGQIVEIELERALEPSSPLELRAAFEHDGFDPLREPAVRFRVPAIAGARRTRIDLAVTLAESMDAVIGEPAGWRALSRQAIEAAGLDDRQLIAGLHTSDPAAEVALELRPRPSRGEYEAVTHVLALERQVRVRIDLRLAVLDRAVEEIVLHLPVDAALPAPVLGEEIREVAAQPAAGGGSLRRVRFTRPWLGSRELRCEYETAHEAGAGAPIPAVELEGSFGARRYVVFQSAGPVELDVERGPGALPADLDELPELGGPWSGGRVLFAYRLRRGDAAGTFRTAVHAMAPVLSSFARELSLTTVLGKSGASRTRAEMLLGSSGLQRLEIVLSADAKLLAADIDGEPVEAVRREESGSWSIPLPPRSYGRIGFSYERGSSAAGRGQGGLGSRGRWSEAGPRFPGVPIGVTRWRLHHPPRHLARLRGGNLEAPQAAGGEEIDTFAARFFGRLLGGRRPRLDLWREEPPGASAAAAAPLLSLAAPALAAAGGLAPAQDPAAAGGGEAAAPLVDILAEGVVLEGVKVGGEPLLAIAYAGRDWRAASRRTVLLATVLGGLMLALRRGRRAFYLSSGSGLLAGTLVPVAIGWESPSLAIPFCEALIVLLAAAGLFELARAAGRLGWLHPARRRAAAAIFAAAAPFLAGTRAPAAGETAIVAYDPAALGGEGTAARKVYLPRQLFQRLWRLAHPEKPEEAPPPADLAIGAARYTLRVEGETFQLAGRVALNVLAEGWVALHLPFDEAQLARILLDGAEAGVAQIEGRPAIAIRGRGERVLELELAGRVERQAEGFRAAIPLLGTPAASLQAELPPGARPRARGAPCPPLVTEAEEATIVNLDLGPSRRIELLWSFPKLEGRSGSQLESLSASELELSLDGYRVERRERIRVSGQPLSAVEYRVLGGLRIAEVSGADLAEWSEARDGGETRLSVFFTRPRETAELVLRGWAPLGDEAAPLAALALEGAVRQESFFGLRHGARRRWHPETLAGERRAVPADAAALFEGAGRIAADRFYQLFGSGEGKTVAALPLEGSAVLASDAVAAISAAYTAISVRTRYGVSGPGPFRQHVLLPPAWKLRAVRGQGVAGWDASPEGEATRLEVWFEERAASGTEVIWSAELEHDAPPSALSLPLLRTVTADPAAREEVIHWAIAAAEELELSLTEAAGLLPVAIESAPRWVELPPGHSYRLALRSTGLAPEYRLSLAAAVPAGRLRATVVLFARLGEEHAGVNCRVRFEARQAGRDRFRLRLPAGATLQSLEAPNQKSRRVTPGPAGSEIELVLISPASLEIIDIVYRLPRTVAGVTIEPLTIFDGAEPLEAADHYVGVVQSGEAVVTAGEPVNLTPLPAERFPFLPESVPAESLRPTFRATGAAWRLPLAEEGIGKLDELPALIELAEIDTVVAGDGTRRTRAAYRLRNRKLQFLLLELPRQAELWGVTVAGRPAPARRIPSGGDAGRPLVGIPLERVSAGDLDLEVIIVYAEPRLELPGWRGSRRLEAPRTPGTQVFQTLWRLELPRGYSVSPRGGNLQPVPASVRHASRVQSIVEQIDRLHLTLERADSERLRQRTWRSLLQLEQALSDDLSGLEEALLRAGLDAEAAGASKREVEQRTAESRRRLEEGRKRQAELGQAQALRRAAQSGSRQAGEAVSGRDRHQLFENTWRAALESRGAPEAKEPAHAAPTAGGVRLDELIDPESFGGFRVFGAGEAAEDSGAERSRAREVDASGLKPLPETPAGLVTPALETPAAAAGPGMTFRRAGGDPELVLTFTHRSLWPRVGAAAVLLLAAGAAGWRAWRRARETRN